MKLDIAIPPEIEIYAALRGITVAAFILEIDTKYSTLSEYYRVEKRALTKRIDRLI